MLRNLDHFETSVVEYHPTSRSPSHSKAPRERTLPKFAIGIEIRAQSKPVSTSARRRRPMSVCGPEKISTARHHNANGAMTRNEQRRQLTSIVVDPLSVVEKNQCRQVSAHLSINPCSEFCD